MKPLRAKIHFNENMEENRRYKVRCAVVGSKPPPIIDWYINGQQIDLSQQTVRYSKTINTQCAEDYFLQHSF